MDATTLRKSRARDVVVVRKTPPLSLRLSSPSSVALFLRAEP